MPGGANIWAAYMAGSGRIDPADEARDGTGDGEAASPGSPTATCGHTRLLHAFSHDSCPVRKVDAYMPRQNTVHRLTYTKVGCSHTFTLIVTHNPERDEWSVGIAGSRE